MSRAENIVEFPTRHLNALTQPPIGARVLELCADFEILLKEDLDTALSGDIEVKAQPISVLENPLKRLNDFLDGFDKSKSSNGSSIDRDLSWGAVRRSLQQKIKTYDTETFRGLLIYALRLAARTYPGLTRVLAERFGANEDTFAYLNRVVPPSAIVIQALAHDVIHIESIERFLLLSDEAQALLVRLCMNNAGNQTDVFRVESCMNYLTELLEKCDRKKMDFLPGAEQQKVLLYIKSRFGVAS